MRDNRVKNVIKKYLMKSPTTILHILMDRAAAMKMKTLSTNKVGYIMTPIRGKSKYARFLYLFNRQNIVCFPNVFTWL